MKFMKILVNCHYRLAQRSVHIDKQVKTETIFSFTTKTYKDCFKKLDNIDCSKKAFKEGVSPIQCSRRLFFLDQCCISGRQYCKHKDSQENIFPISHFLPILHKKYDYLLMILYKILEKDC